MKKNAPTPEELRFMRELGYLGRRGLPVSIRECERLWRKYPKEYAEQNRLGRNDADAELNPMFTTKTKT